MSKKPEELEISDLPRDAKIVAAQTLKDMGFSYRNTAKLLGLSKGTIETYQKEDPVDNYDEFRTAIENMFKVKQREVAAKALSKMGKQIDKDEVAFRDLLNAYKELNLPKTPQTAIQINIDETRNKYE